MSHSLSPSPRVVFTIGHSNHTEEVFLELLGQHNIQLLADVRSQPYCRHAPHFNSPQIQRSVQSAGIHYLWLGQQLGGRPDDPALYDQQGYVLYGRVAASAQFRLGIERLEHDLAHYRPAIMCSEENPASCHRNLLVGRVLTEHGVDVRHIRGDGRVQDRAQLLAESGSSGQRQGMLFEELEVDSWKIYTIGFTKTTAAVFFGKLKQAGIRRLLDIRLNNTSQLAGFAKQDDLSYFLGQLCGAQYLHEPRLAPTRPMLDAYKKEKRSWDEFERSFRELMAQREIERTLDARLFDVPTVLLCSEATADHCHRRLVVEYLSSHWADAARRSFVMRDTGKWTPAPSAYSYGVDRARSHGTGPGTTRGSDLGHREDVA